MAELHLTDEQIDEAALRQAFIDAFDGKHPEPPASSVERAETLALAVGVGLALASRGQAGRDEDDDTEGGEARSGR